LLNGEPGLVVEVGAGAFCLFVITASHCGLFTPQYSWAYSACMSGLERDGLTVRGFSLQPSFSSQELGSESEDHPFLPARISGSPFRCSPGSRSMARRPSLVRILKRRSSGFLGTANHQWNFLKFSWADRDGKPWRALRRALKPEQKLIMTRPIRQVVALHVQFPATLPAVARPRRTPNAPCAAASSE
jgi:glutathione peroxidase-family protein